MLLQACARISPRTSAIHGTKSKEPARQEKSPARAAEMKVIIRTAARDEINHLEITSRSSHSSLETVGMTVNAFFHIVKFMSILLLRILRIISNLISGAMGFRQLLTYII